VQFSKLDFPQRLVSSCTLFEESKSCREIFDLDLIGNGLIPQLYAFQQDHFRFPQ
jgi:hypothetical protein